MANLKPQPTKALLVVPSNYANIPNPAISITGTNTSTSVNQLIDTSKNFFTENIYAGDIVYNISVTPPLSATIIDNPIPVLVPGPPPPVYSSDTLTLSADIFTSSPEDYIIYQSSPQGIGQNPGCVLYVGNAGDIVVTTAGNDIVTFFNVQNGAFIPVQIIKVWQSYDFPSGTVTTSATDILALW
jgi:hypothetical protein